MSKYYIVKRFIHMIQNTYLLSTYSVLGIIPGIIDKVLIQTENICALIEHRFWMVKTDNKENK